MDIGQHFLAALSGKDITTEVKALIRKEKILGFSLFKRNFDTAEELLALTTELQALARQAGYTLVLAVDHEGGRRVFRLPEPFTPVMSMRALGKSFAQDNDATKAFTVGKILAAEAKAVGFNVNLAPVVDVDHNQISPIIGDRAFSANPDMVYILARQIVRAHLHEGVLPCLKHFPGHGATKADSHHTLPHDERTLEDLVLSDLIAYQKLIAEDLAPLIMTAHVLYPKIDKDLPATLSPVFITEILRRRLNFQGLVLSDDLLMQAIEKNHTLDVAAKLFFQAGGDVALICDQPEKTLALIESLKAQEKKLAPIFLAGEKRLKNLQTFLQPVHVNPLAQIKENMHKNAQILAKIFRP